MLSRLLDYLGARTNLILLGMLAAVLGTWAFFAVAARVLLGSTQSFDDWALRALRDPNDLAKPLGPHFVEEIARDLTALGGIAVLTLTTLAVAGFLLLARKFHAMLWLLAATAGGLVLSLVLKQLIDRPRPDLVPHLSLVYTTSFPSGHSMLAATVYLTLGAILARLTPVKHDKLYFLTLATALTVLVGISRVYMGVHYPTDVLAGWTAGLVWSLLCWLATRALQRQGTIESDRDQPPPPKAG